MIKNEIFRNEVEEKIKMLKYFRELVVSAYNNSDTHTDEEVLKFSKYIDYLDKAIVFNIGTRKYLESFDLRDGQ